MNEQIDADALPPSKGLFEERWVLLKRNRMAYASFWFLIALFALAIMGKVLTQNIVVFDPKIVRLSEKFLPPLTPYTSKITPKEVDGWKSQVKRTAKGGQQITWDNLGAPQPFNQPFFLPMNISWPKKKGTYSMKVTQVCPDEVMVWGTPDGPATANKPSPPLTPLPQVQVVEKVKVS